MKKDVWKHFKKLKIGDYEPCVVKKGFEETTLDVPEGEVFWMVQDEGGASMDVKEQIDAVILSKLIRIEQRLKKIRKQVKV